METDWECSVCGCEDNEDLDDPALPCSGVSRPSRAAAGNGPASPYTSARHSCTQCLTCGGQGVLQNGGFNVCGGGKNKATTNRRGSCKVGMKRSLNSIRESGRGVKRSQPTMANGSVKVEDSSESDPLLNMNKKENTVQAAKIETKSVDSEKSGAPLLGRRFNDVPAIVPIKKRRIHMMAEVTRSPSPPPRSISPGTGSLPLNFPSPSPPPLLTSPRSPSPLARLSPLSSPAPPSRSPSPRSPPPKSRSPLSSSPAPPPRSPSPQSPSPEPRSPPSSSPAPPPRSPSFGSASPLAISRQLPNLVSLGCELNAEDGNVMVTCSGGSHFNQMMESNEQGLADLPCLPPTQLLSPRLFCDDNNVEEEEDGFTSPKESPDVEDLDMAVESEESAREARGNGALDAMGQHACLEGMHGMLGRSKSGFSQDDRSHWDLNMKMETWEKLTDQDAVNEFEGKASKQVPCTSISVDSNESKHNEKADVCVEALVKVQTTEEQEIEQHADFGNSECRDIDDRRVGKGETTLMVPHVQSDWKTEDAADNIEFDNPASWEGETASDGEVDGKSWIQEEPQNDAHSRYMPDSKLEKDATSSRTKATGWNQASEEPEAEENVDYGDSDWRDTDDLGLDGDEKAAVVLPVDINWKAVGETGNLADNPACREVDTVSNEAQEKSGLCEEGLKASFGDSQLSESSLEKDGNSGRSKFTGWDRLPEGFKSIEEAWKVMKGSSSQSGSGKPWVSSQGRGSSPSSQSTPRGRGFGSRHAASRDSFTSVRGEGFFGDTYHSDEHFYPRKSFNRGRWLDDSHNGSSKFTSPYDNGRGRKYGRGPVAGFRGMGRAGRWIEQGGSLGKWSSGRGHANAAAVAAAKVESSGFVVAPNGTITKAGGGITLGRGGMQSMTGGRRGAHRPLTNVGRGPPVDVEAAVNFPSRVHVGTGRGMVGTGSNAGMNVGGRGLGPNVGQGYVRGMAERRRPAGQGLLDKYQGPFLGSGGMEPRRSESPRRLLHPLDHSNRNNHTSPSFRPEFRVERPNTPPSHRSLGHSKLVPTTLIRSQGSSSPSSKWSVDRREAEMLPGRDFKQSLPRPLMPPTRASPHVVHGNPLMAERDRQILSEARHSPSVRAGLNSSVSAENFGNGSPEIRRLRQDGNDEIRGTGSRSKEGDYSRTSPRDYDKDRDNRESLSKRDRFKENDRLRDSGKLSGKDGRSIRGNKRASTWEDDDDVAPRRRRPS